MELTLKREFDDGAATSGILFIDGVPFHYTLEDTRRHEKVAGSSRIPTGRYPILMRYNSPMADKYRANHGTDGMMWLQNVPGFEYVYLHIGNTEDDSEGCILVAETISKTVSNGKITQRLINSRPAYKNLHGIVSSVLATGQDVAITIIDE